MTEINDRELIEKALLGKNSGYRALVNRYKEIVFSLAFRLLQDRENAE
jgi:hypothetical protein